MKLSFAVPWPVSPLGKSHRNQQHPSKSQGRRAGNDHESLMMVSTNSLTSSRIPSKNRLIGIDGSTLASPREGEVGSSVTNSNITARRKQWAWTWTAPGHGRDGACAVYCW